MVPPTNKNLQDYVRTFNIMHLSICTSFVHYWIMPIWNNCTCADYRFAVSPPLCLLK